jgi:hypothetical protein
VDPLFDKKCNLVGWIEPENHIFDLEMNWVAYLSGGHAWSSQTGNWLGPVNGMNCLDQEGRPVAWNPDETVEGSMRPMRPMRAMRAMRPMRPMRPMKPMRPMRPKEGVKSALDS